MKKIVFTGLSLLIIVVEILLCIRGPLALVQRPSLILSAVYGSTLPAEQEKDVAEKIEYSLAKTRDFAIISQNLLEDFLVDRSKDMNKPPDRDRYTYKDHLQFARELGIEKIAIALIWTNTQAIIETTVNIWDVESEQKVMSGVYQVESWEDFFDDKGWEKGMKETEGIVPMARALEHPGYGLSIFDYFYFGMFVIQLLIIILVLSDSNSQIGFEISYFLGFFLFLFAFVYALNANMDYVQRFISIKGQIQLAESTWKEQLFAMIRFFPFFILNAVPYGAVLKKKLDGILDIRRSSAGTKKEIPGLIRLFAFPLTLLSAFLFSVAYPSFLHLEGLGFLGWIALVPILLVILYSKFGAGIIYGIAFGGLQGLLANYWHGTYSYISLAFSSMLIVMEYVPFIILLVLFMKTTDKYGLFIVPSLWILFDYLRSTGYIGYPWGLAGVEQYQFLPIIQIASVTGIWGVGFLVVLVNAAIAYFLAGSTSKRQLISVAVLFSAVFLFGSVRLIVLNHEEPRDSIAVSLIQQNRDPRQDDVYESYEAALNVTEEALADPDFQSELIVWPEGAFKSDLRYWGDPRRENTNRGKMVNEFLQYQKEWGIYLLSGTTDHETIKVEDGTTMRCNYNSSVLLNTAGEVDTMYHKMHLVPFTEHFPFKEEYPWLYEMLQNFDTSDWEVGEEHTVFQHPKVSFYTPICFEDVFPDDNRQFVLAGAEMVVNISNDYWSLNPVEGMQHGVHALFRAVENNIPMVRCTASGYTVAIQRTGKIIAAAEDFYIPVHLNSEIDLYEHHFTLYTRWGDWFIILCIGVLVTSVVIAGIVDLKQEKR